jgi:hypothetical protein
LPDQKVLTAAGINTAAAVANFFQIGYVDINGATLGKGSEWGTWLGNPPLRTWFVDSNAPPYYPNTNGRTKLTGPPPNPGMEDEPGPRYGFWKLQSLSYDFVTCVVCSVGKATYILGCVEWGFSYTVEGPIWNRATVGEKFYVNNQIWTDAGQTTFTVTDGTGQHKITIGGAKIGWYTSEITPKAPGAEMATQLSKFF